MVNYHPAKYGGQRPCGSGDITYSIFHGTTQDQLIKGQATLKLSINIAMQKVNRSSTTVGLQGKSYLSNNDVFSLVANIKGKVFMCKSPLVRKPYFINNLNILNSHRRI